MIVGQSLVDETRGFVLWWHPKAACTSLKVWFAQLQGLIVTKAENTQWMVGDASVHVAIGRFRLFEPPRHGCLPHVTAVRDPRARLVSHYRQQISAAHRGPTNESQPESADAWTTFRGFVEIVKRTPDDKINHHARAMAYVLGAVKPAVVHLEIIHEDWPREMQRLGLPLDLPPVCQQQPRTAALGECCADWPAERFTAENAWPPWRDYYDEELEQIVRLRYAEDFRRFYPA